MKIRVLGCSGGIGGPARTTSFLIDDDILIDAGTGVGDLSSDELKTINHVFLTHSHLDHTTSVPLLLDSVGPLRNEPVVVHAQAATIDALKTHIFNWQIWPDFSEIPDKQNPYLVFSPMTAGDRVAIADRHVQSIAVEHTVPAVGYLVANGRGSFAFSGDTTCTDEFWSVLNACNNLKYLVVETTFLEKDKALSQLSKHLCPSMLATELQKLHKIPETYITHLMPDCGTEIMKEIAHYTGLDSLLALKRGHVFEL